MSRREAKPLKSQHEHDTDCAPDAVDKGKLEVIARTYRMKNKPNADATFNYYASLPSIEVVIDKAALAMTPQGKRHPHQYRLKKSVLEQVRNNLLNNKQALLDAASFHDIWEIVKLCRVEGFGELAIYDCATRIAAWLGKRPGAVYLHAGTRKGAAMLGIDVKDRVSIPLSALPAPFRTLEPYEVEDVLCIYKDDLIAGQDIL